MITQPGTRPQILRCNDVVLPLGVGGAHLDMVDDLRRTAKQRSDERPPATVADRLLEALGLR